MGSRLLILGVKVHTFTCKYSRSAQENVSHCREHYREHCYEKSRTLIDNDQLRTVNFSQILEIDELVSRMAETFERNPIAGAVLGVITSRDLMGSKA